MSRSFVPYSHLSLFVSLPHVSYFLTISSYDSYLHHYIILCPFLSVHHFCRLSSAPLQRGLAPSSGRAYLFHTVRRSSSVAGQMCLPVPSSDRVLPFLPCD